MSGITADIICCTCITSNCRKLQSLPAKYKEELLVLALYCMVADGCKHATNSPKHFHEEERAAASETMQIQKLNVAKTHAKEQNIFTTLTKNTHYLLHKRNAANIKNAARTHRKPGDTKK